VNRHRGPLRHGSNQSNRRPLQTVDGLISDQQRRLCHVGPFAGFPGKSNAISPAHDACVLLKISHSRLEKTFFTYGFFSTAPRAADRVQNSVKNKPKETLKSGDRFRFRRILFPDRR
jgi:hypothetical protein